MRAPRFQSRQWFWALTLGAFLWAYAGKLTAPTAEGKLSFMQQAQYVINWPVDTTLTPGSWIAGLAEHTFVGVIEWASASHTQTQSNEALVEEVRRLNDEMEKNQQIIAELRKRLEQFDNSYKDIPPGGLVGANVTGYSVGVGSNEIKIDRGKDRLRFGMPVIFGSYIVGRVMNAEPMTSTVRLLTDQRSKVRAKIIHRADGTVVVENCLVEGAGNGQLVCNSIEKTEISTRIDNGDVVELADGEWPKTLQHFIIGTIEEKRQGDNPYRYKVLIRPSVNMTTARTVDVLVQN